MAGAALATGLGAVGAPVVTAPAPRASTPVVRARLDLDTSALGQDGAVVAGRIRVRAEALLRAREVLPARDAADPRIVIQVLPLEGGEPGYRCLWSVMRGETAVEGSQGASLCRLCTEDELVEHIEAALERLVPQLPVETPPPVATAAPEVRDRPKAPARKTSLGPLGVAGAVFTGVGVVGFSAGVTLVARGRQRTQRGPGDVTIVDGRLPGAVLTGLGAAALVGGVMALVVDVRRIKRSRRVSALRVGPGVSRTPAVVVSGRF